MESLLQLLTPEPSLALLESGVAGHCLSQSHEAGVMRMSRSKRHSPFGVDEVELLQPQCAASSSTLTDDRLSKRCRVEHESSYYASIFNEIVDSRDRDFMLVDAVSNDLLGVDEAEMVAAVEQQTVDIANNNLLRYFKPISSTAKKTSQQSSSSSSSSSNNNNNNNNCAIYQGSSKQTDMSRFLANLSPHHCRMETDPTEAACLNSREDRCRSCHLPVYQDVSSDSFDFARCSFCTSIVCCGASSKICSSSCFLCGERFCKFCLSSNYTLDKYEVTEVCIDCNW